VLENLLVARHRVLQAATAGASAPVSASPATGGRGGGRGARGDWLRATALMDRADDPAGACPWRAAPLESRGPCAPTPRPALPRRARGRAEPAESEELSRLLLSIRAGEASAGGAPTPFLLIEPRHGHRPDRSRPCRRARPRQEDREGPPAVVRNDRHVIAAYLGEDEAE
jgi:hypothetical protein